MSHHPLREVGHAWLLVPAALLAIAAAGVVGALTPTIGAPLP